MINASLWRVPMPPTPLRDGGTALTLGLQRHLAVAPLTTVCVRIAPAMQTYVGLPACPGCQRGRCQPGCLVDALHRTLHATYGVSVRLGMLRTTLTPRPYRAAWWVWPGTAQASPLAPSLLSAWDEARLWLHIGTGKDSYPVGGIVVTGADGPAVPALLAPLGWKTLALPRMAAQAPHRIGAMLGIVLPQGRVPWMPGQWIDPSYPVPEPQGDHPVARPESAPHVPEGA